MAIICNLDNAKPRITTQKVLTRTRTRSQLDNKTTPEPIDLDDIDKISPPESITPRFPSRPTTPSRRTTPTIAVDDEPHQDIPSEVPPNHDVMEIPPTVPQPDDIVMSSMGDQVIDVDDPEGSTAMAKDFRRMSISSDPSPPTHYHYTADPEIDPANVPVIAKLLEDQAAQAAPIRYTRSSMTIKPDEIMLDDDDEEPDSITSALKQKYSSIPASRRTSGKAVPLNS